MKNEFFKEVKHKEKDNLFDECNKFNLKKTIKTGVVLAGSAILLGAGIKLLKDVTD